MMGGPPRTRVTVRAERLPGLALRVRVTVPVSDLFGQTPNVMRRLAYVMGIHGTAAVLTLLDLAASAQSRAPGENGGASFTAFRQKAERLAKRIPDAERTRRLTEVFSRALAAAAVPVRVGVFMPIPPDVRVDDERCLDLPTSLAVLACCSGPVFLPRRHVHPSLITLRDGLLQFPGVSEP